MINRIEMEINNGRTMQLAQQEYDGEITLTTYHTENGLVDKEISVSPGEMVMVMNYYRYQKENGAKLFDF